MKKKEEEWAKTKEELEKLQARYKELEEQNVDLLKSKNDLTLEVRDTKLLDLRRTIVLQN